MTARVIDSPAAHSARCRTGCSARAASGHAPVDAHPRDRGHRHFLRRLHGAGDRVRDAAVVSEWGLTPAEVGLIISAGYVGQLFGAIVLRLAGREDRPAEDPADHHRAVRVDGHRLPVRLERRVDDVFRFIQGIGTGGEVPVASAYINEFIGAKKRGRFFLLYEVIFPIGLMFAGMAGYFLVPMYGWKAMFVVGLIPAVLTIPAALVDAGIAALARLQGPHRGKADAVVNMLENERDAARHSPAGAGGASGRSRGNARSPTGANCSRASTSSGP